MRPGGSLLLPHRPIVEHVRGLALAADAGFVAVDAAEIVPGSVGSNDEESEGWELFRRNSACFPPPKKSNLKGVRIQ